MSDEFYTKDYDLSEEDKKYEIQTLDSNWHYIRYAIEELYYSKIIPKNFYLEFENLTERICNYIGHAWEMDQCNHLEHAYCSRCRARPTHIEQIKEMRVKFPMARIGQVENGHDVFKEFLALEKDNG